MAAKSKNQLMVTLPSDKEILLTRVFDAPRQLVFEAMTRPEHVRRWWPAMDGMTMTVCEIDFRVGGKWRYAAVGPDGNEFGFHGEYREIVPPEKVVNTEIFDPFPEEVTVCTMTLEEQGKKTHFQCRVVHTTKEGRDGHIGSGMEHGAGLSFDRLEEICYEMSAAA